VEYEGLLDFANLEKHGIEFVSQEGKQMCVAFGTEEGLDRFEEHLKDLGLGKTLSYKQILEAICGFDNWTADDRSSWAIKHLGLPKQETFPLDVELWPLGVTNQASRQQLRDDFEKWIQEQGIQVLDNINLDSLHMYRVEASEEQSNALLEHLAVRLVDLPPKMGITYQQLDRDANEIKDAINSPHKDAAKVCILDSGLASNHPLLGPAVAEGVSFIKGEDESDHTGHGTAVAGIALYGDVEACNESNFWQPQLWLYNGKIMSLCSQNGGTAFDAKTIETTISEAVQYFAELGCKIFNLSLGNSNAPYDGRHIRGIAYVLDKLARELDVLFVVSSGNFSGSDEPPVPGSWREDYPEYLLAEQSVLIDPAPALNVLTVGSLAKHDKTVNAERYPEDIQELSPASEGQPSPFTRHGPSIRGAFKPDVMATGGNLACPMRQEGKQWKKVERGIGVMSCSSDFVGNTLFKELSGSSFSAPYVTHLAGRLLNEYPKASSNLLRAMLVNHANLSPEIETTFSEKMRVAYKNAAKTKDRDIARDVSGNGKINEDALFRSSEHVVVIFSEESIENDQHHFYELPLPDDFLRSQRATRELRVTLAYSPVVRTTRQDYTATRLSYRLVRGTSLDEVQRSFNKNTQDETETRNDDSTSNRDVTAQQRDRGTVQSSVWTFRSRKPGEKWFVVVTRQDRPWGKALCEDQERYALVVTATDRDNEEARLYTQIQQRIQERDRTRLRDRLRSALRRVKLSR
jgi:hypothetical protein